MNSANCDHHLESILSESAGDARKRERSAFDQAAGSNPIALVIYGAGNFGRTILRGLQKNGIKVLAFADANPRLNGQVVEGIPVLSPEDAVLKFGSELFLVCVWHPDQAAGVQEITERLHQLGAPRAIPFVHLFWKYADTFLPHYFWDLPSRYLEHRSEIRQAYELFSEPASKLQFIADLELRTTGLFRGRPAPCPGSQYFPSDLFKLIPEEFFVDCGAYDGDTIRALARENGGHFARCLSLEADPENFTRLQAFVAEHPELRDRVTMQQVAVGREAGTLRFAATAGANASVSSCGETIVNCVALDHLLAHHSPSMIKMDIEGSELDALHGAARTIASHQPLLAICLYHRPEHLWQIPLHMQAAEPTASMYLRSYSVDGFDTVCYAVPTSRSLQKLENRGGIHYSANSPASAPNHPYAKR